VPWGGVGPTIRSFDCGYGLGQVTSGMENETGVPTAQQALVGTHLMFNLAESVRILAGKWNDASKPIAGDGNPASLEDWYFAIWSYNGWASTNHPLWNSNQETGWLQHPLNPWRDPLRGEVYHCDDPTAPNFRDVGNGDPLLRAGDFTYPERVYGCMRYPPRYQPPEEPYVNQPPVTYPAPVSSTPTPATAPGDATATPTTDPGATATPTENVPPPPYPTATPTELSTATATESALVVGASEHATQEPDPLAWQDPDEEGRVRMWPPVEFLMPDLNNLAVGNAFLPQTFLDCFFNDFSDGCPAMDFPTTIDEIGVFPHTDPTPPLGEGVFAVLFGAPNLTYNGPLQLTIVVDDAGFATSSIVSVGNSGTWLAPFRIRTSAPWLLVRHPDDDPGRILNGSIAVGKELLVIVQPATDDLSLVTTTGYDSVLEITVDPGNTPDGTLSQTVWIEPLFGGGDIIQIAVTIEHGEVDPNATPTPVPTQAPNPLPFRAVLPGLSASQ
jgi:hypothetical protein